MANIDWPDDAIAQWLEIATCIRQADPVVADKVAAQPIRTGNGLCSFPNRGRRVIGDTRTLPTVPPYIIRCRTDGDAVVIPGVRHDARCPDNDRE